MFTFKAVLLNLRVDSPFVPTVQDAAFTKLLTLNLQRVFSLTQKCLPLLRAAAEEGGKEGQMWKDPARIINVRSLKLILYL